MFLFSLLERRSQSQSLVIVEQNPMQKTIDQSLCDPCTRLKIPSHKNFLFQYHRKEFHLWSSSHHFHLHLIDEMLQEDKAQPVIAQILLGAQFNTCITCKWTQIRCIVNRFPHIHTVANSLLTKSFFRKFIRRLVNLWQNIFVGYFCEKIVSDIQIWTSVNKFLFTSNEK